MSEKEIPETQAGSVRGAERLPFLDSLEESVVVLLDGGVGVGRVSPDLARWHGDRGGWVQYPGCARDRRRVAAGVFRVGLDGLVRVGDVCER